MTKQVHFISELKDRNFQKVKSLSQKRNTLHHNQDSNLSEEETKRRVESVKSRCSPSKDIHHNGADLQVS